MNHTTANKEIYLPPIAMNQPISTILGCSLPKLRSNPFSDQMIPPFFVDNSLDFQNLCLKNNFVKIPSFPHHSREDTQSATSSTEWFDLEDRHSIDQLHTNQFMEKSALNKLFSLQNHEEFYTRDSINFEKLKLQPTQTEDLRKSIGLNNTSKKIIKRKIDFPQHQITHKEEPAKTQVSNECLKKIKHGKLRCKRNPWRPSEDAKLLELVEVYGEAWAMISAKLVNRTGKQIRDRYLNILRPNLKKGDWSPQEDNLLVALSHEIGHKWSSIAKHMPGRSEAQVKNRFYSHIKKRIEGKGEEFGMLGLNLSCSGTGTGETESEGSEKWMEEERQEKRVKVEEYEEKMRVGKSGVKVEADENIISDTSLNKERKIALHFQKVREEEVRLSPKLNAQMGLSGMRVSQKEANIHKNESVMREDQEEKRTQPINEKEVDLVIEILARYYQDNDKGKKGQRKDEDEVEDESIANKVNRLHQLDLRRVHLELILMRTQQEMNKIQSR